MAFLFDGVPITWLIYGLPQRRLRSVTLRSVPRASSSAARGEGSLRESDDALTDFPMRDHTKAQVLKRELGAMSIIENDSDILKE